MSEDNLPAKFRPSRRRVVERQLDTIADARRLLPSLALPRLPAEANWLDGTCFLNSPPPDGALLSLRWQLGNGWLSLRQSTPTDACIFPLHATTRRQLSNGCLVDVHTDSRGVGRVSWRGDDGAFHQLVSNVLPVDALVMLAETVSA